ncbi:flagellar protein FlgN [Ferrimonas balearica]|uniref:flagellar protein FlgN n=1 Tax=Ferrimonas balearica TaxID=44012 RepID=UPI001F3BA126|nr:flagellar protein FlgN [Ferrimonas balearica]MBY6016997.1 flagellar protein FlgN [Halomonas denitrificans]MBY6093272.1 flagellar protein FlgN [Ferrimonas balearica]
MTSKRERLQLLVREIRLDIEDYQQLRALLRYQRSLLERRDQQALSQHNERVETLCAKLRQRAERRTEILTQLGVRADATGMQRLFHALGPQSRHTVTSLWNHLQQLVRDCQAENEVNGKLLAGQKSLLDRVLGGAQDQSEPKDYSTLNANT